jgi:hypothetical protein
MPQDTRSAQHATEPSHPPSTPPLWPVGISRGRCDTTTPPDNDCSAERPRGDSAALIVGGAAGAQVSGGQSAYVGVSIDLLCIDELGYMELDRRGAELLFQALTEREEKNSVAIASNESFGGWTKTFTDPRLCAAIVDRLTFGGNIIETGTDSYRFASTRAARTQETATS